MFLKSIRQTKDPAVFNIWESIKSRDALLAAEFFPMNNIDKKSNKEPIHKQPLKIIINPEALSFFESIFLP